MAEFRSLTATAGSSRPVFVFVDGSYFSRVCSTKILNCNRCCDISRQCPGPGKPTSGQFNVERKGQQVGRGGPFQYGDRVRWVCDTGFTGNTNAACRADSTWSKNTPTCTRISCPDPSAPTNGNYIVTGLKYEDTVTYTCRLGFDMLNHPNRPITGVCMANRMWSSTQPTCERKLSYCESYSPIQNGNVNCSGRRIHDICQYQCDSGYVKERHSSIRCIPGTEVNGRWSERGSCSRIRRNSSNAKLVTRMKQEVLSTYGSILQALSDLQVVVTNSAQKMLSWS
ncbi:CUB and sushi domain-containing protein 3-like [Sycon ciliatum]|uniref:CUB and sushi domain-containing protein 3-like n=1 Tax=Sycon ciliatum TaxID=27933 RepID=UPI0031F6FB2A